MIAVLLAYAAATAGPVFAAPEIADEVLAEQRGGVRLPNGIDLALTVQTQTAVNGAIVLQTVFSLADGAPTVTVLTPQSGRSVAAPAPAAGLGPATVTAPTVTFDRRGGLQVSPGVGAVPVVVGASAGGAPAAVPQGLQAIDTSSPVATDAGLVSQTTGDRNQSVSLVQPDLSITHLIGGAFGSAIANARNDVAIQTETTIGIDLRNAGPDVLGSAMLRVENVVLDALGSRL